MPAAAQVPPPAAAAAEGKPHNNLAKKMGGWGKIKDELQQIVPQAAPDKVLAVKVHVAATKVGTMCVTAMNERTGCRESE
jgi:hypothetical protein